MSLEGQLLGRYRVLRLVGSGGMGEVYLADDPTINRQVAIKVVNTEAADHSGPEMSKGAARLFQREAKAIAMLDHTSLTLDQELFCQHCWQGESGNHPAVH